MVNPVKRGGLEEEGDVWQAISAFEKILEVMPDDRSSLETLSHAYEHAGDRVRALDYLLRLAGVVLAEQDEEMAGHLCERLAEYGEEDERVREMTERLAAMRTAGPGDEERSKKMAGLSESITDRAVFRVTDELSFAWKLFEAGELSQEDYSAVAHDLAELSIDPHPATVSVLHVLETRAFSGLERVMGFSSRDTKTPIISLQAYEVSPETAALLSLEFMIRRGALIFATLLEEVLVVVMNPYDRTLQDDVRHETGRTCHFFMTIPSEFDDVIALLKAAV